MSETNDKSMALSWKLLNETLINKNGHGDKIIGIEKLKEINSVEELFGKDYFKIIYIGDYHNIGHWTVLFDLDEGLAEFFCSYGIFYDEIREFCERLSLGCVYNRHRLQEFNSIVCGKWCIARINNFPNDIDDFVNFFIACEKMCTPDQLVNFLYVVKEY